MVFANAVSDVAAAAVVALLVSFDSLNFEVQLQQEVKEEEEGISCSNMNRSKSLLSFNLVTTNASRF